MNRDFEKGCLSLWQHAGSSMGITSDLSLRALSHQQLAAGRDPAHPLAVPQGIPSPTAGSVPGPVARIMASGGASLLRPVPCRGLGGATKHGVVPD